MSNLFSTTGKLYVRLAGLLGMIFVVMALTITMYEKHVQKGLVQEFVLPLASLQLRSALQSETAAGADHQTLLLQEQIVPLIDRIFSTMSCMLYIVDDQGTVILTGSAGGPLGIVRGQLLSTQPELQDLAQYVRRGSGVLTTYRAAGETYYFRITRLPDDHGYIIAQATLVSSMTHIQPLLWIILATAVMTFMVIAAMLRKQIRRLQVALVTQSITDSITRLPNRQGFDMAVQSAVKRIQHDGKGQLSAIIVSFDNLFQLSGSAGPRTIDIILKQLAEELRKHLNGKHIICRGDVHEFILLLPDTSEDGASYLCKKIQHELRQQQFQLSGIPFRLAVSQGLCTLHSRDNAYSFISRLYQSLQESQGGVAAAASRVAH